MTRAADLRQLFLDLHTDHSASPTPGVLTMPNPWDIGSARLLASLGFEALATTSAGFAGSLGRHDQDVRRDELIEHAASIAVSVDVPLNVDAEDCFADELDGVAETVELLAATDAAGMSIEDFDPRRTVIRSIADATERVAAARSGSADVVLTARAENHLHGVDDLDDTIERLVAYRSAGADVLYAPGLSSLDQIRRVVDAVDAPVNVLALPGAPTIPELATVGVARVSVGSLFAWAAYGALVGAARELLGPGTSTYAAHLLSSDDRHAAFH